LEKKKRHSKVFYNQKFVVKLKMYFNNKYVILVTLYNSILFLSIFITKANNIFNKQRFNISKKNHQTLKQAMPLKR
jgi:hypothetical protein